MNITIQLLFVFLIVTCAIMYFVRNKKNRMDNSCDSECKDCDLFNHCKKKK